MTRRRAEPGSGTKRGGSRATTLAAFVVSGLHLQDVVRDRAQWAARSKRLDDRRVHDCPLARRRLAFLEMVRMAAAGGRALFGTLYASHPLAGELMSRRFSMGIVDLLRAAFPLGVDVRPRDGAPLGSSLEPAVMRMPSARAVAIDLSVRLAAAHLVFPRVGLLEHLRAWNADGTLFHYVLRLADDRGLVRRDHDRVATRTRQRHLRACRERLDIGPPRPTLAAIRALVDGPEYITALRFATLADDLADLAKAAVGEERTRALVLGIATLAESMASGVPKLFPDFSADHGGLGSALADLAGHGAQGIHGNKLLGAVAAQVRSPILLGELRMFELPSLPWSDLLRIVAHARRAGRPPGRLPKDLLESAATSVVAALDGFDVTLVESELEQRRRTLERCELAIVAKILRRAQLLRGRRGMERDSNESLDSAVAQLSQIMPRHPLLALVRDS
jgi:hypothetical protein